MATFKPFKLLLYLSFRASDCIAVFRRSAAYIFNPHLPGPVVISVIGTVIRGLVRYNIDLYAVVFGTIHPAAVSARCRIEPTVYLFHNVYQLLVFLRYIQGFSFAAASPMSNAVNQTFHLALLV